MENKNMVVGGIIVLIIIALAAGTVFLSDNSADSNDASQQAATTTPVAQVTAEPTAMPTEDSSSQVESEKSTNDSQYNDGTYTASGSYSSPGGTEMVRVSLTIDNDTVADATVTSLAQHSTSKQYQAEFISGYKAFVIGKPLDEIKVSRVSGSSLTSSGFNKAAEDIKQQANAN